MSSYCSPLAIRLHLNSTDFRTSGEISTCVWFDIWGIRGWSFYELNDGIPLWAFSRLTLSWCVWDMSLFGLTHTRLRINPLAGSAAILCRGGVDVIWKESWPFYWTISTVRLHWMLEEPKGPKDPTPFVGERILSMESRLMSLPKSWTYWVGSVHRSDSPQNDGSASWTWQNCFSISSFT